MKCENCSHAEMCKWIDELEGRGCDFGEPFIPKSETVTEFADRCRECGKMKKSQDAISRETIEDIKADIEAARYGLINDGLDVALRIIDKHTEGRM